MSGPADDPKVLSDPPPITPREAVQRWRLVLAREALRDDAAQREATGAWEAALMASGLPMAGLDLPRPRPRHALAAPLSSAIPGEAELLDLYLVERLPAWRVREALSSAVPPTFRLVEAYDVWLGEPALPGRVTASVYRAAFDPAAVDPAGLRSAAEGLLAAPSLPRTRRKGEATIEYDLRPFLAGLDVAADEGGVVLRMTLRHDPEKGLGRPDETIAALADALGAPLEPTALVRERLELAELAASGSRSGPRPSARAGPRPGAGQAVASARRPRK